MNNLVTITYKSNGEQKIYSGDYGLMSDGNRFIVTHGPFKAAVFIGSRNDFFVDIESPEDDDQPA